MAIRHAVWQDLNELLLLCGLVSRKTSSPEKTNEPHYPAVVAETLKYLPVRKLKPVNFVPLLISDGPKFRLLTLLQLCVSYYTRLKGAFLILYWWTMHQATRAALEFFWRAHGARSSNRVWLYLELDTVKLFTFGYCGMTQWIEHNFSRATFTVELFTALRSRSFRENRT